jgi:hypothetical protein
VTALIGIIEINKVAIGILGPGIIADLLVHLLAGLRCALQRAAIPADIWAAKLRMLREFLQKGFKEYLG